MLSEDAAVLFTIGLFILVGLMLMARGRWAFFQGVIFIVVMGSNIKWQWTPNAYLAALIGIGAAYGATVAITWFLEFLARKQRLHLRPRQ